MEADLSRPQVVRDLIQSYDLVLGALSSTLGFQTLLTVIEAGRNYCDVSFMPEDAWQLDELARSRGVTAVVDCGVAPGMSNLMAGFAVAALDQCDRIEIYVGGLPQERRWPFQYKAAFAPADVLEEYVRPARLVEHGQIVTREALSEPELMDFAGVGTLEAFNTDGLRSLTQFLKVPFMKEKTLRYPGHIDLMRAFRATGLLSLEAVQVGGVAIKPRDLLSTLMFPQWQYQPGEQDLTVMRVIAAGRKDGSPRTYTWDLLDHYDESTGTTSMARTTAFPAAIIGRMIARGTIRDHGVLPPERLGHHPGMLQQVLDELRLRGVMYDARISQV
jgi:saccharopine dehydrogenase-like NADP-dependent oxidoreductase